jgi:hypothetical protein
MKYTTCVMLLCAALLPLGAQTTSENRAYFRVGGTYNQNDLKAYLGDRQGSPIYEIGYDFNGPTEHTGLGVYFSYLAATGDLMEQYRYYTRVDSDNQPIYLNDGMKQNLFVWRLGFDMRFRTPIKGFTPYGGFNVNWYDGFRTVRGTVENYEDWRTPGNPYVTVPSDAVALYQLPAGNYPEGQAKLGIRFGAEYRINKNWGVSIDQSVSHWMSRSNATNNSFQTSLTGNRYYKGVNPVAPTWVSFSVQYRWSIWN